MASTAGELQAFGSIQGNFRCTWTIKNFSSFDSQIGKPIKSETFELEEKGMGWYLLIYPGGMNEEWEGYASCFVYVNGTTDGVRLKCTVSLSNAKGEGLFTSSFQKWMILTSEGLGYLNPIKTTDLLPKLINDVLIINVEANYCISCVKDGAGIHRNAEITPMVKLTDDLKKLRVDKESSDCVISVGGQNIPVHSALLVARSEVFSAMFKHETLEKGTCRVEITDFEKQTVDHFMEFIYSGTVRHMGFDLALELLRASDKYAVSDLQSYCGNFFMSILDDDNVYQILVNADIYNAEKLREHALKYFCENFSEEFFESQRSIFTTRPNLLCDIIKGLFNTKKKSICQEN